jgi:hypothetical protein
VTITNNGNAPLTFCSTAVVPPNTIPVCFDSNSTQCRPSPCPAMKRICSIWQRPPAARRWASA